MRAILIFPSAPAFDSRPSTFDLPSALRPLLRPSTLDPRPSTSFPPPSAPAPRLSTFDSRPPATRKWKLAGASLSQVTDSRWHFVFPMYGATKAVAFPTRVKKQET